jgi:hypothetical protein
MNFCRGMMNNKKEQRDQDRRQFIEETAHPERMRPLRSIQHRRWCFRASRLVLLRALLGVLAGGVRATILYKFVSFAVSKYHQEKKENTYTSS